MFARACCARLMLAGLVGGLTAAPPLSSLALAQDKPAARLEAKAADAKPVEAKAAEAEYEPRSGQEGKDVVWVPTPQVVADKMLEIARVTARDYVIDLGSGDGRLVITAAKLGARALGIEYNPDMVALSRREAEKEGMSRRATFVKADLFETSFAEATVVTMFLLPDLNLKLRPKILALRPGTRIVSNTFTMGDWQPDATADLGDNPNCKISYCKALYWVVPRQVAGSYKLAQGDLTLTQEFQMLKGTLKSAGSSVKVSGRVRGEQIELTAGKTQYRGVLKGSGKAAELELRESN